MKPIAFSGYNVVYGKNQKDYLPLPAFRDEQATVSCWQLSWKERFKMFFGGRLWLTVINFKKPLQPQRPSVDSPLIDVPAEAA